jgi:hypothetical protein
MRSNWVDTKDSHTKNSIGSTTSIDITPPILAVLFTLVIQRLHAEFCRKYTRSISCCCYFLLFHIVWLTNKQKTEPAWACIRRSGSTSKILTNLYNLYNLYMLQRFTRSTQPILTMQHFIFVSCFILFGCHEWREQVRACMEQEWVDLHSLIYY